MVRIIENETGRRLIQMSTDDIISVVREYQRMIKHPKSSEGIRFILNQTSMYLPEDL